ncbi:MAG: 30S ribosomal protein S6 [Thermoleophilia bacterium]|nr:30S ribosomal protein S6 [Thermoleophilia bacterium]
MIKTSNYEIMIVLSPEAEAERRTEILDRFRKMVTDAEGSVDKVDEWGKKRLAYEINHLREAYYYVLTLTASTDVLDEISRILRITDEVLRYMPVALKEKAASES